MRIAILSRNKNLHSIRRLFQEARKAKIDCRIINPLDCQMILNEQGASIHLGSMPIEKIDAILPRIGASITDYGLAVVKHFESMGIFTINDSQAIADSRNKMRCLQVLKHADIPVPKTVLTRNLRSIRSAVEAVGGMPVVLKVLKGTQGRGVMLVHTPISLGSVVETLRSLDEDILIQQFIAEGAGQDYRAFVIGDRVIAAMMRTAPKGEFRSNIHCGGEGTLIKLPKAFEKVAIRSARVLGLEIAGVDLMQSQSGPVVLEVNSSPGFEGIEKATGLNIAAAIIRHMRKRIREQNKRKPRKRK